MITVNREDYPVIDSHCHPFPLKREASFEQYWMMSLSAQPIFHSRRTVGYEMASRELAKLFCIERMQKTGNRVCVGERWKERQNQAT